jgi:hypothetical protein
MKMGMGIGKGILLSMNMRFWVLICERICIDCYLYLAGVHPRGPNAVAAVEVRVAVADPAPTREAGRPREHEKYLLKRLL